MDFDITMPAALFAVTATAMLLNKRVEGKLKTTFENREFRARDTILFVAMISAAVSIIVFVPQMTIIAIFLFSYSTLLFTFSYLFSSMRKRKAQFFCSVFGIAGLAAGTVALLGPFADSLMFYGALAAYGLAACAFVALLYEQKRADAGERWYLAMLPPALFLLLYLVYGGTFVWYPYLFDVYAVTFAILVTLYLGSLFTWKTTFVFAGLLTAVDIVLVFGTKAMGEAATTFLNLGLPVFVVLPNIPLRIVDGFISLNGLGLGDFFFAGILAVQTFKKFGKKFAVLSVLAMTVSFEIFAVLQATYQIHIFPATVSIICGWLPVVACKLFAERKTNNNRIGIESKMGAGLAEQGA